MLRFSGFDESRWFELGLALGLFHPTLNTIKSEHRSDTNCLLECLKKWLHMLDNVEHVGCPTWNSLSDGLGKLQQKSVINKLSELSKLYNSSHSTYSIL